jgi:hypothetical protein
LATIKSSTVEVSDTTMLRKVKKQFEYMRRSDRVGTPTSSRGEDQVQLHA